MTLKQSWKEFKKEIIKQKDAVLAGGVVGWSAAYYLLNIKGIDISMAIGRQGLIDTVMSSTPALIVAKYKVYLVFITIGMVTGYLVGKFVVKKKGRGR